MIRYAVTHELLLLELAVVGEIEHDDELLTESRIVGHAPRTSRLWHERYTAVCEPGRFQQITFNSRTAALRNILKRSTAEVDDLRRKLDRMITIQRESGHSLQAQRRGAGVSA